MKAGARRSFGETIREALAQITLRIQTRAVIRREELYVEGFQQPGGMRKTRFIRSQQMGTADDGMDGATFGEFADVFSVLTTPAWQQPKITTTPSGSRAYKA